MSIIKYFTRPAIAVITASAFFISSVCCDFAYALSADSQNKPQIMFSQAEIPSSFGKITDNSFHDSKNTIINIQDVHCNPEVQRNIYNILSHLHKNANITKIFLEGACGNIDFSSFYNIKDEKLREEILEILLAKGLLTGTEYFAVKNNIGIYGIEDSGVYNQNLVNLLFLQENRTRITELISDLREKISVLENDYLGSDNKRLGKFLDKYKKSEISSEKFYSFLDKQIKKINSDKKNPDIDYSFYENFNRFKTVKKIERTINKNKLNEELALIVEELKNTLSYTDYAKVLAETGNFSDLSSTIPMVYKTAEKKGIDLNRYKNFKSYAETYAIMENTNPVSLYREEMLMVSEIRIASASNADECNAIYLSYMADLLENMLTNKMLYSELRDFNVKFPEFFNILNIYYPEYDGSGLSGYMKSAEDFYSLNVKRNDIFFDSIADIADGFSSENKNTFVLVTGGFHSDGLKKLFTRHSISFLTITPNITQHLPEHDQTYEKIIAGHSFASANAFAPVPLAQAKKEVLINTFLETYNDFEFKNLADVERFVRNLTEFINAEMSSEKPGYAVLYKINEDSFELDYPSGEKRVFPLTNFGSGGIKKETKDVDNKQNPFKMLTLKFFKFVLASTSLILPSYSLSFFMPMFPALKTVSAVFVLVPLAPFFVLVFEKIAAGLFKKDADSIAAEYQTEIVLKKNLKVVLDEELPEKQKFKIVYDDKSINTIKANKKVFDSYNQSPLSPKIKKAVFYIANIMVYDLFNFMKARFFFALTDSFIGIFQASISVIALTAFLGLLNFSLPYIALLLLYTGVILSVNFFNVKLQDITKNKVAQSGLKSFAALFSVAVFSLGSVLFAPVYADNFAQASSISARDLDAATPSEADILFERTEKGDSYRNVDGIGVGYIEYKIIPEELAKELKAADVTIEPEYVYDDIAIYNNTAFNKAIDDYYDNNESDNFLNAPLIRYYLAQYVRNNIAAGNYEINDANILKETNRWFTNYDLQKNEVIIDNHTRTIFIYADEKADDGSRRFAQTVMLDMFKEAGIDIPEQNIKEFQYNGMNKSAIINALRSIEPGKKYFILFNGHGGDENYKFSLGKNVLGLPESISHTELEDVLTDIFEKGVRGEDLTLMFDSCYSDYAAKWITAKSIEAGYSSPNIITVANDIQPLSFSTLDDRGGSYTLNPLEDYFKKNGIKGAVLHKDLASLRLYAGTALPNLFSSTKPEEFNILNSDVSKINYSSQDLDERLSAAFDQAVAEERSNYEFSDTVFSDKEKIILDIKDQNKELAGESNLSLKVKIKKKLINYIAGGRYSDTTVLFYNYNALNFPQVFSDENIIYVRLSKDGSRIVARLQKGDYDESISSDELYDSVGMYNRIIFDMPENGKIDDYEEYVESFYSRYKNKSSVEITLTSGLKEKLLEQNIDISSEEGKDFYMSYPIMPGADAVKKYYDTFLMKDIASLYSKNSINYGSASAYIDNKTKDFKYRTDNFKRLWIKSGEYFKHSLSFLGPMFVFTSIISGATKSFNVFFVLLVPLIPAVIYFTAKLGALFSGKIKEKFGNKKADYATSIRLSKNLSIEYDDSLAKGEYFYADRENKTIKANKQIFDIYNSLPLPNFIKKFLLYASGAVGHEIKHLLGFGEVSAYGIQFGAGALGIFAALAISSFFPSAAIAAMIILPLLFVFVEGFVSKWFFNLDNNGIIKINKIIYFPVFILFFFFTVGAFYSDSVFESGEYVENRNVNAYMPGSLRVSEDLLNPPRGNYEKYKQRINDRTLLKQLKTANVTIPIEYLYDDLSIYNNKSFNAAIDEYLIKHRNERFLDVDLIRYYLAVFVRKNIVFSGLEINDNNIVEELTRWFDFYDKHKNKVLFNADTRFITVNNDEVDYRDGKRNFLEKAFLDTFKKAGIDFPDNNIQSMTYDGSNKNKIIEMLLSVEQGKKYWISFRGHGEHIYEGEDYVFKLGTGTGTGFFGEMAVLTDKEITDIFVKVFEKGVNPEDITISFNTCSSDYAAKSLISQFVSRGYSSPNIVSVADNVQSLGYSFSDGRGGDYFTAFLEQYFDDNRWFRGAILVRDLTALRLYASTTLPNFFPSISPDEFNELNLRKYKNIYLDAGLDSRMEKAYEKAFKEEQWQRYDGLKKVIIELVKVENPDLENKTDFDLKILIKQKYYYFLANDRERQRVDNDAAFPYKNNNYLRAWIKAQDFAIALFVAEAFTAAMLALNAFLSFLPVTAGVAAGIMAVPFIPALIYLSLKMIGRVTEKVKNEFKLNASIYEKEISLGKDLAIEYDDSLARGEYFYADRENKTIKANKQIFDIYNSLPLPNFIKKFLLYASGVVGHEIKHLLGYGEGAAYSVQFGLLFLGAFAAFAFSLIMPFNFVTLMLFFPSLFMLADGFISDFLLKRKNKDTVFVLTKDYANMPVSNLQGAIVISEIKDDTDVRKELFKKSYNGSQADAYICFNEASGSYYFGFKIEKDMDIRDYNIIAGEIFKKLSTYKVYINELDSMSGKKTDRSASSILISDIDIVNSNSPVIMTEDILSVLNKNFGELTKKERYKLIDSAKKMKRAEVSAKRNRLTLEVSSAEIAELMQNEVARLIDQSHSKGITSFKIVAGEKTTLEELSSALNKIRMSEADGSFSQISEIIVEIDGRNPVLNNDLNILKRHQINEVLVDMSKTEWSAERGLVIFAENIINKNNDIIFNFKASSPESSIIVSGKNLKTDELNKLFKWNIFIYRERRDIVILPSTFGSLKELLGQKGATFSKLYSSIIHEVVNLVEDNPQSIFDKAMLLESSDAISKNILDNIIESVNSNDFARQYFASKKDFNISDSDINSAIAFLTELNGPNIDLPYGFEFKKLLNKALNSKNISDIEMFMAFVKGLVFAGLEKEFLKGKRFSDYNLRLALTFSLINIKLNRPAKESNYNELMAQLSEKSADLSWIDFQGYLYGVIRDLEGEMLKNNYGAAVAIYEILALYAERELKVEIKERQQTALDMNSVKLILSAA